MFKYAFLFVALLSTAASDEARRRKHEDPFTALDRHITHTLAYHYLWPWSQLMQAAAAIDAEEHLEEPQIVSDDNKFEININVKRFKPDELRVKVKNRYILVEGRHKKAESTNQFMANHFVQQFVLPLGSKSEEVTAVLKENGVLSISAPKHKVPPPPPERVVPIEVLLPEKTESPVREETTTEKKEVPLATSTATPLELESEATTVHGKIRKKELKTTTKTVKDNEVTKGGDGNGLDYALIEADE